MTHPVLPPILLVEDLDDDILLIQRVFAQAGVSHPFQVVKNGADAKAYLAAIPPFADRALYPFPILMLLDLKMPGISGFEVLEWLRAQPAFRALRVIVLTSSNAPSDIDRAYRLGANSYLLKTADVDLFIAAARSLALYWLTFDILADPALSTQLPPPENLA